MARNLMSLVKARGCKVEMSVEVAKLCKEFPGVGIRDDPVLIDVLDDILITREEVTKICKSFRECLETQHSGSPLIICALNEYKYMEEIHEALHGLDLWSAEEIAEQLYPTRIPDDEDLVLKYHNWFPTRDDIAHLIAKLTKVIGDVYEKLVHLRRLRPYVDSRLMKNSNIYSIVTYSMDTCHRVATVRMTVISKLVTRLRKTDTILAAEEEEKSNKGIRVSVSHPQLCSIVLSVFSIIPIFVFIETFSEDRFCLIFTSLQSKSTLYMFVEFSIFFSYRTEILTSLF